MTGNDILKKAASLLGYSDADGEISSLQTIINRGTVIINQIATDLGLEKISQLSDKLLLSPKAEEILLYGVSMLMAISLSDNEKSDLFTRLYNSKRVEFKSEVIIKQDVLPADDGGVL